MSICNLLLLQTFLCVGKKYIIKRFCEIYILFNNSQELRYILNQLYIQDFLIWLQTVPESLIESLHFTLSNVSIFIFKCSYLASLLSI